MKTTRKHLWLWGCALVATLMTGCKADVNLNDIDTSAEFDLGLSLPIGTMNITINDILGDSLSRKIHVGEDGILFFRDTFSITRQYHDVDLESKISKSTKFCDVHQALDDMGMLVDNKVTGTGFQIPLTFPFVMKLNDINSDETNERLDSAHIKNARFVSYISTRDLGLKEEWINKVEIVLSDEFSRQEGSVVKVFEGTDFHYNDSIAINIDEFTVCLMKNRHPSEYIQYINNVKDSINLDIKFYFTIPKDTVVSVPSDAAFKYDLSVQFIDYYAIWGYFKPSNQMYDESVIDLFKEWSFWEKFKDAILPFAEPVINMYTTTQVSGAMVLHGDYLCSIGMDSKDTVYATFNGQRTFRADFSEGQPSAEYKYDHGYLPLSSEIGDSARTYTLFNKEPDRGHIDRLFTIRPRALGYKFIVDFNQMLTPQLRVTPNTYVRMDADFIAPFKFNKGFRAVYESTIDDVNFGQFSIDSLLSETPGYDSISDGQLALVLLAKNYIPLQIKGVFRFVDAAGTIIMDPKDPSKPLQFSDQDTLIFPVPQYEINPGASRIIEPGQAVYALVVDKDQQDLFGRIKKIQFKLFLDADELDQVFQKDPAFMVKIADQDPLKLGMGLSADVKAVFHLFEQE